MKPSNNPSNTNFRTIALTLLIAVALVIPVHAPSNWYNPERTSDDVNHGVDYVKSMAITNSEDYYSNTSGHCAIGQIGENTSRVFYQWYRNNQSLYEYTWGNITEHEVLYLNFDEGEGSIAYDKSGKGNDGTIYLNTSSGSGNTNIANAWVSGKYGKALDFDIANVKFAINREPEGSPFGVDVAERQGRSDICLNSIGIQPHDYVDCVTLSLNNKEL